MFTKAKLKCFSCIKIAWYVLHFEIGGKEGVRYNIYYSSFEVKLIYRLRFRVVYIHSGLGIFYLFWVLATLNSFLGSTFNSIRQELLAVQTSLCLKNETNPNKSKL